MAITREGKLYKQMADGTSDNRFSTALFGQIVATSEPVIQRQIVELFAHTCEMIAINYDFGNFTKDDLPYLRICKKIVKVLSEEYDDPI